MTILACVDCDKNADPLEAYLRKFNTGRCGHCGGAFRVALVEYAENTTLQLKAAGA